MKSPSIFFCSSRTHTGSYINHRFSSCYMGIYPHKTLLFFFFRWYSYTWRIHATQTASTQKPPFLYFLNSEPTRLSHLTLCGSILNLNYIMATLYAQRQRSICSSIASAYRQNTSSLILNCVLATTFIFPDTLTLC
jgi:hypothetical protein